MTVRHWFTRGAFVAAILALAPYTSAQTMVQKGTANVTRYVMITDSTDGSPETAVTITGLDLQYTRSGAAPATKVDATALSATDDAHADNQCIAVDATSSPGLYRCDWPDAAFATGVDKVILVVSGTGYFPAVEEIQLVDFDPEDGVRLGLTALPNAAADAAGGLVISDAGGLDADAQAASVTAIEVDTSTTLDNLVDDLESRLGTPSDFGSGTSTIAANLEDLADNGTASYDRSTDSLQAARDHVGDGTNLTEAGGTGDQLTAVPWNSAWDAEVESEALDALVSIDLDHLVNAAEVDTPANDSIIAKLAASDGDWSGFAESADSLEALRDHIADGTNLTEAGGDGDHLTESGGTGDQLTAIPWNASWDAEVESEATDALEADGLDHLVAATVAGTDVTDDSIIAMMVADDATADWDTFDNTTESLEAIRNRGDSAWTTGAGGTPPHLLQNTTIATLASQTSFTLTAGSADDDAYNNGIVVVTDQSTAEQKAVGTVSDYTGSSKTITLSADPGIYTMAVGDTIDVMSALGSAGSAPTAAQVADAVWDEAQADHTAGGSFGETATETASILADTGELQSNQNWDVWDDAARTLTELDEDNTTIDLDGSAVGDVTNALNIDQIEGVDATDQINTQADTAMADIGLDHLISASVAGTDVADDSIIAQLAADDATADWDTYNNTTDSLEATRNHIGDGTNLTEAGGDGDHLTEAGATGDHLTAVPYNSAWDGEIQSEAADALTAYDPPTRTELTTDTNSVLTILGTPADTDLATDIATIDTNVDDIEIDTGTTLQAEVDGIQADTEDIQIRLPAALVSGKMDSDTTAISGSTTAADTFESMMDVTVIEGAATATTLTTTTMSTDLTEATDDHYIGLILTWTSGVLAGQSTDVTDYNGTTKLLTFTAVTEAPSNGDTFVLR